MVQARGNDRELLDRLLSAEEMPACSEFVKLGRLLYGDLFEYLLFCELRAKYLDPDAGRRPRPGQPGPSSAPEATEPAEAAAELKGLCVDCKHRSRCSYWKSPAGVWHCEEYE